MANEQVLVFPTQVLRSLGNGTAFQGVLTGPEVERYLSSILDPFNLNFMDRRQAEEDPEWKQVIPYCVLQKDHLYFTYRRSNNGGETRLYDRRSLGVGGHINHEDGDTCLAYEVAFFRELAEETGLLFKDGRVAGRTVRALLNDDSNPVGQVHFGIVHIIPVDPYYPLTLDTTSVIQPVWTSGEVLTREKQTFESWSQLVIDHVLAVPTAKP